MPDPYKEAFKYHHHKLERLSIVGISAACNLDSDFRLLHSGHVLPKLLHTFFLKPRQKVSLTGNKKEQRLEQRSFSSPSLTFPSTMQCFT